MRRDGRGMLLLLSMLVLALSPMAAAAPGDVFEQAMLVDVQHDRSEHLTLTVTEPAHYSHRHERFYLPRGATPLRIVDAAGEVAFTSGASDGQPFVAFTARSATYRIEMTRQAPEEATHPLYTANVSVGAFRDATNKNSLEIRLPSGYAFFYAPPGAAIDADSRVLRVEADDAVFVRYAYEAPLPEGSGLITFTHAPFRVFVPLRYEAEAREISRLSAPLIVQSAEEAGLPLPWPTFYVRFAPEREFGWEAGSYLGSNIITIRQSVLTNDPEQGYPYNAVRALTHETFHALSGPHEYGEFEERISWWVEGAAVHAERLVRAAYPESASYCRTGGRMCWHFPDQLDLDELESRYARASWSFDPSWAPRQAQTDAERQFGYAYSGFIVSSYVERFGADAYARVWTDLAHAVATGEGCPCDAAWLERALIRHAGGALNRDELYHPYRSLYTQDKDAFRDAVGSLTSVKPEATTWTPPGGVLTDDGAWGGTRTSAPAAFLESLPGGPTLWGVGLGGLIVAFVVGRGISRRVSRSTILARWTCPQGHRIPPEMDFCPRCGEGRRAP